MKRLPFQEQALVPLAGAPPPPVEDGRWSDPGALKRPRRYGVMVEAAEVIAAPAAPAVAVAWAAEDTLQARPRKRVAPWEASSIPVDPPQVLDWTPQEPALRRRGGRLASLESFIVPIVEVAPAAVVFDLAPAYPMARRRRLWPERETFVIPISPDGQAATLTTDGALRRRPRRFPERQEFVVHVAAAPPVVQGDLVQDFAQRVVRRKRRQDHIEHLIVPIAPPGNPAQFQPEQVLFRRPHGRTRLPSVEEMIVEAQPIVVTWTAYGGWFLYEARQWDPLVRFHLEAIVRKTSGGGAIWARLFDVTSSAGVSNSEVSTTSGTLVRIRSGPFSLVDGHEYRVQFGKSGGSGGNFLRGVVVVVDEA